MFNFAMAQDEFKTKNYFQRQLPAKYVKNLLGFTEDVD